MLLEGCNIVLNGVWWVIIFVGVMILFIVLVLNIFVEGLIDVLVNLCLKVGKKFEYKLDECLLIDV